MRLFEEEDWKGGEGEITGRTQTGKKGEWKFSVWKAKACGFTILLGFCLEGMVEGLIDPLDG